MNRLEQRRALLTTVVEAVIRNRFSNASATIDGSKSLFQKLRRCNVVSKHSINVFPPKWREMRTERDAAAVLLGAQN